MRLGYLALALSLATPLAAARRRAVEPPLYPPCAMVTGTAAVTFTRDEGRTIIPTAVPLRPYAYTYGLAALDTPKTIVAWHKDDLLISSDAGCSWRVAATVTGADFPPKLAPARGGRVYAWSDNRFFLVRWDARGAVSLKQPVAFLGFGVDPNDADHVRAGGDDGSIWDSRDAGQSWQPIGRLAGPAGYYRFTFDPRSLDHVVAGTLASGAFVSRDGGVTWTPAQGTPASANVFNLVVSPADGNVVWAMGLDTRTSRRSIFLSRDGGSTYETAVEASADVTLINGPTMAAHPTNPNVLYFVFGTYFQNEGTYIYRYDAATRSLTKTHNDHDDINAIAFSPDDPGVMYLGLESEG